MVLTYFIVSVVWLIERISVFNVSSVIVFSFVLIYAQGHTMLTLLECLATVFRQLGWLFSATGKTLAKVVQRMKDALGGGAGARDARGYGEAKRASALRKMVPSR